jgi:DNA-directed RNA polymerase specialized sigma24 family protein
VTGRAVRALLVSAARPSAPPGGFRVQRPSALSSRRGSTKGATIYETRYAYPLRIARRTAASADDAEEAVQEAAACFLADYDRDSGAPPLAWLTLMMKRRCRRLRDNAPLDRRIGPGPEGEHEEPTALIERLPAAGPTAGPAPRSIVV